MELPDLSSFPSTVALVARFGVPGVDLPERTLSGFSGRAVADAIDDGVDLVLVADWPDCPILLSVNSLG